MKSLYSCIPDCGQRLGKDCWTQMQIYEILYRDAEEQSTKKIEAGF